MPGRPSGAAKEKKAEKRGERTRAQDRMPREGAVGAVDLGGGSLWFRDPGLAVGCRVRVRVQARDVSLSRQPPVQSSIQNVLPGRIEAIGDDEHPGLAIVRVQVGESRLLARLTRRAVANLNLEPGQPIWVQVKSAALTE